MLFRAGPVDADYLKPDSCLLTTTYPLHKYVRNWEPTNRLSQKELHTAKQSNNGGIDPHWPDFYASGLRLRCSGIEQKRPTENATVMMAASLPKRLKLGTAALPIILAFLNCETALLPAVVVVRRILRPRYSFDTIRWMPCPGTCLPFGYHRFFLSQSSNRDSIVRLMTALRIRLGQLIDQKFDFANPAQVINQDHLITSGDKLHTSPSIFRGLKFFDHCYLVILLIQQAYCLCSRQWQI